jgi:hypothetical protein
MGTAYASAGISTFAAWVHGTDEATRADVTRAPM